MLSQYESQILSLLEQFAFDDPDLARPITWHLYGGRTVAETSFTISDAVRAQNEVISEELDSGVTVQQARNMYLIKESALPAGITVKSLTKNDRITDDGVIYRVTEIDKTLEFVVQVVAIGAQ